MNTRNQLLCLWSGVIFILLFLLGFAVIGGFVPPPSPSESMQAVAAWYRHDTDAIRAGLIVTLFAAAFSAGWVAVISVQMKRIEGSSCVMAYTQLGTGMAGILLFVIPITFWIVAAFRPYRPPATQQLLNDLGWIPFIIMVNCFFVQCLAIAAAVLGDTRPTPVYPRWVGYANAWTAFLLLPGVLAAFFHHGAFGWNGIGTWWLLIVDFTIWFCYMVPMTYHAIRSQEREVASRAASDPPAAAAQVLA